MQVRALKTTFGSYGDLQRGQTAEIPDYEATELIALGYMVEVLPIEKQIVAKMAANDNAANDKAEGATSPLVDTAPQIGGQTGEDKPQSSSQVGRQRKKRRSN